MHYNVNARHKTQIPVKSAVIQLRPEADGKAIKGEIIERDENGEHVLLFRYGIIRGWKLPVDFFLNGSMGCCRWLLLQ